MNLLTCFTDPARFYTSKHFLNSNKSSKYKCCTEKQTLQKQNKCFVKMTHRDSRRRDANKAAKSIKRNVYFFSKWRKKIVMLLNIKLLLLCVHMYVKWAVEWVVDLKLDSFTWLMFTLSLHRALLCILIKPSMAHAWKCLLILGVLRACRKSELSERNSKELEKLFLATAMFIIIQGKHY